MRKLNHNEIIIQYNLGLSCDKIANIFKCNSETIRKILIKHGIKRRPSASDTNPEYSEVDIIKMYSRGENTNTIAKKLGTYNTTIRRILLRNNIKVRSSSDVWDCRPLLFNNKEEAQYWIGFLAADGAISKSGNTIRLNLAEKDIQTVYKFAKFANCSVSYSIDKRFNTKLFRAGFNSKKNADYLKSIGITACKSKTISLSIPINRHIFRGVLDGDGSVSKTGLVTIVTASSNFLMQLKTFLDDNDIHNTYTKQKNGLYTLRVSSYSEVVKLFDLIYKDATIFLERKKNRMRLAHMKI